MYSTVKAIKTEAQLVSPNSPNRTKRAPIEISSVGSTARHFALKALGQHQAAYYFIYSVGGPAREIPNPRDCR